MVDLTQDEQRFLARYGLTANDVYDGRGVHNKIRRRLAKEVGKAVILKTPCAKAGHRLATRAGHCVQCDPKKLAFQQRHSESGYVYIAGW